MAETIDLVQAEYVELKLSESATFKIRYLKRKDKGMLLDLKKKAEAKDADLEDKDIVDLISPYILDGREEEFKQVADELNLSQLLSLQKAWFAMNGLTPPEQAEKSPKPQE